VACESRSRPTGSSRRRSCRFPCPSPRIDNPSHKRDWLSRFRELDEPFEARHRRAAERLAAQGSISQVYVAILGLRSDVIDFRFPEEVAKLQRVVDPPGELELAGALKDRALFGAIGRYSHGITHELAVRTEVDTRGGTDVAWWIIGALRLRTQAELLIPAMSDHSWSTIAGITDGSCDVRLLEDFPQARVLGKSRVVTSEDLTWVADNLITFAEQCRDKRFRLVVEALGTYHHSPNSRLMTAQLWAGIEALAGADSETTFRLSSYLAAYLEPRGQGRLDSFARISKLYGIRSKAVHGAEIADEKLAEHVLEVRELLARLLIACIENGRIPSRRDFETALFS